MGNQGGGEGSENRRQKSNSGTSAEKLRSRPRRCCDACHSATAGSVFTADISVSGCRPRHPRFRSDRRTLRDPRRLSEQRLEERKKGAVNSRCFCFPVQNAFRQGPRERGVHAADGPPRRLKVHSAVSRQCSPGGRRAVRKATCLLLFRRVCTPSDTST